MRSEICASNALPVHVEDSLFAADLRREFEADGVHLSNERKAELAALQVCCRADIISPSVCFIALLHVGAGHDGRDAVWAPYSRGRQNVVHGFVALPLC